jgi:RNA polymerase sigma-70 factor (ECF subfamily)
MPSTGADALRIPLTGSSARKELEARFASLLAENRASLSRLAFSYSSTAADREDLLQDIALAIWQALPNFRGECSVRTFVYRIAQNRALSAMARRGVALLEIEDAPPDPAPLVETAIARQEESTRLAEAVRRLPLLYRQVVVLMLEGLEYGEIADVLGISESNVGVRLNRARPLLREMMRRIPGGRR